MEEIFNLASYKEHLIRFYRYDSEKDTYLERVPYIERIGDIVLQKYINDTQTFCFLVLDKMNRENHNFNGNIFTRIDIEDDSKHIFTNLRGGWSPDTIYHYCTKEFDLEVSRYLIKRFFKGAHIDLDYDEEEISDGDIHALYSYPVLHISMKENEFQELYCQYEKDSIRLLKKKQ